MAGTLSFAPPPTFNHQQLQRSKKPIKIHNSLDSVLHYLQALTAQSSPPSKITFISAMKACSLPSTIPVGKSIHAHIIKFGFQSDRFIATSVITFYSSSNLLNFARQLFDEIPHKDPPLVTTMLLAYFKSGDIANARILFDKTDDKDVIVWNAMLGGYVQCCLPDKALELFREMQNSKVIPNEVTLINVLSACSMMGCVEFGEWVHAYIERQFRVLSNSTVNNSLINMYSKCGRLDLAFELFLVSQCKNLETWNTMLTGFAIHGHASEALSLFSQMIKLGSLPDSITFVVLVMAFCHRGMVDDARCCFNCMTTLYGIEPDAKHVNCMVDVLSRGGYLDEAYILIENMPFEGDTYAWGALLSGCFTYKNYELGLNVARRLLELEPRAEGRYVALLNLYSLVGRIEDAIKLRKMMDEMGIKQSSGISVIEVDGVFHGFIAGDSSHAESKDIYTMIHNILPNLDVNGQLC